MSSRYQVDAMTAIALTTRLPALRMKKDGPLEVIVYPDYIKICFGSTFITIDLQNLPHPPWADVGASVMRCDNPEATICVVSVFDTPTQSIHHTVRYEPRKQVRKGKEIELLTFVTPTDGESGLRITRVE